MHVPPSLAALPGPARRGVPARRLSSVRHAVARAKEAEALVEDAPPGFARDTLLEIARLWRELAQHRMLEELDRSRRP